MARTRVSTRSRNAQLAQEMLACVMAGGWLLALPSCAQRPPAAPPAPAAAEAPKGGLSDTVQEIIRHGLTMTVQDQKLAIFYGPNGQLEGSLGILGGTWTAEGSRLCIDVPGFAENQCLTYPDGKKSGDSFVIEASGGPIPITIR